MFKNVKCLNLLWKCLVFRQARMFNQLQKTQAAFILSLRASIESLPPDMNFFFMKRQSSIAGCVNHRKNINNSASVINTYHVWEWCFGLFFAAFLRYARFFFWGTMPSQLRFHCVLWYSCKGWHAATVFILSEGSTEYWKNAKFLSKETVARSELYIIFPGALQLPFDSHARTRKVDELNIPYKQ